MSARARCHWTILPIGLLLLVGAIGQTWGQEISLPPLPHGDDPALAAAMGTIAKTVLDRYTESDRETYLRNLLQLQLAADNYSAASIAVRELRKIRTDKGLARTFDPSVGAQLYAQAKSAEVVLSRPFEESFSDAFRERFSELDDGPALEADQALGTPVIVLRNQLERTLVPLQNKKDTTIAEAIALIDAYVAVRCYEAFAAVVGPLMAEDDSRRYVVQPDALIQTSDGATISAVVVRKKAWDTPHPTALLFTIYTIPVQNLLAAKRAAVHGYVGVVADTRGKRLSQGPVEPFVHEATDTYNVIDWISKQTWSDGQVGMSCTTLPARLRIPPTRRYCLPCSATRRLHKQSRCGCCANIGSRTDG
jgi:hypothetical protein